MSRAVTEAEFNDWLAHPVTIAVKELIAARREARRQEWEGGSYTDYNKDTTILVNVGNLGECKGLAFVAELDYEQYVGELDEPGKQVGPQATGGSGAD